MADMVKLKKAEEEATKQVDAARKDRAATLRKAKAEAEAEIKAYRQTQMAKIEELKAKHSNDQGKLEELSAKTDADIEQLKADVKNNQQAVIDRLIQVTTTVNLTVPEARKGIKCK